MSSPTDRDPEDDLHAARPDGGDGLTSRRFVATLAAAILTTSLGTAVVAFGAPTFAPSPDSTRTAPENRVLTDFTVPSFPTVTATRRKNSPISDVAVATYVAVDTSTDRPAGLVLRGGGTGADVFTASGTALSSQTKSPFIGEATADNVTLGDVNGDGLLDAAVLESGSTDIGLGSGAGFAAPVAYADTNASQLADVNGDGRADLVSSGAFGASTVSVRLAAADGTLGTESTVATTGAEPRLAVGDVDRDGRADVVAKSGSITAPAQLFRGQAAGAPLGAATAVVVTEAADTILSRLTIADVNADARPDIVALVDHRLLVVAQSAGGGFSAPVRSPLVQTGPATNGDTVLTPTDADLDGRDDLLVLDGEGVLQLITLGSGGAAFINRQTLAGGGAVSGAAAGDFDGDDRPDVAYVQGPSGGTPDTLRVLKNTTPLAPQVFDPAQVSAITTDSATVSARVKTRDPGASVVADAGPTTGFGTTSAAVTVAAGSDGTVNLSLTGLSPDTGYVTRVRATNAGGTVSTANVNFRTAPAPPQPPPAPPAENSAVTVTPVDPVSTTVVAGTPVKLVATVTGSAPPYALTWTYPEGGPDQSTGLGSGGRASQTHAFTAAPAHDTGIIKRASSRTAYRVVSVQATDAFGRAGAVGRVVIAVRPNQVPTAQIGTGSPTMEFGYYNQFVSLSTDPDAPLDGIAREQWDTDGDGLIDVDRTPPGSPCAATQPPAVSDECLLAGLFTANLRISPWADGLKSRGVGPLVDVKIPRVPPFPPDSAAGFAADGIPYARQYAENLDAELGYVKTVRAIADKLCDTLCDAKTPVQQLRPLPDRRMTLTVTDKAGATASTTKTYKVRKPDRPTADAELRIGTVLTRTQGGSVDEEAEDVPALKADSEPGTGDGTKIAVDPKRSTTDNNEEPVFYTLEVGDPYSIPGVSETARLICQDGIPKPGSVGIDPTPTAAELNPFLSGYPGDGRDIAESILAAGSAKQLNLDLNLTRAAMRQRSTRAVTGASTPQQLNNGRAASKHYDPDPCALRRADFGVTNHAFALATRDPKALKFTLPRSGNYSIVLTVYDRFGQSRKVRYDGLQALDFNGVCKARSYKIGAKPAGLKRPAKPGLRIVGPCVNSFTAPGNKELAYTDHELTVNGVKMTPEPGANFIIDDRSGTRLLYATDETPTGVDFDSNPGTHRRAAVDIAVSGTQLARFTPQVSERTPTDQTTAAEAATLMPLDRPSSTQLKVEPGASFHGMTVSGIITLSTGAFTRGARGAGAGDLDFNVDLPTGFGPVDANNNPLGPPLTKPVHLEGATNVANAVLTQKNELRRTRRAALRATAARRHRARARRLVARSAAAGASESTIRLQKGDEIAGFPIGDDLELTIDPATGDATGTVGLGLFGVGGALSPKATVEIRGGHLTRVGGSVSTRLGPLPGNAFITRIGFSLKTVPPFSMTGTVRVVDNLVAPPVGDTGVVSIDGTFTVQPKPFLVSLDGQAAVAGIPLASAQVTVTGSGVTLGARIGTSFGPVSVDGGITADVGSYGFNAIGSANACLSSLCLGVSELYASDGTLRGTAFAACGSVDLLLASVNVGFGVRADALLSPDLYFSGCDVSRYKVKALRAENAAARATPPGNTRTFTVDDNQAKLTVVAHVAGDAVGVAPRATLTGPVQTAKGSTTYAPQTFTLPAELGDFGVTGGRGYVDSDPLKGTVRFVVPGAGKGMWTLQVLSDSPPVGALELGVTRKAVTAKSFIGTRALTATPVQRNAALKAGLLQGVGLPGRKGLNPKPATVTRKIFAGLAAVRPRGAAPRPLALPVRVKGTGIRADELDAADRRRIKHLQIRGTFAGGDRIVFTEHAGGVRQQLGAFIVPSDGRLVADLYFDPARAATVRARSVDAAVTAADGTPRAIIAGVATFTVEPPAAKVPPRVLAVKRRGRARVLVLAHGPSYPGGGQVEWRLTGTGSLGTVINRSVMGRDMRKAGRRWTVTLRGIDPSEDFSQLQLVGQSALGRRSTAGRRVARTSGVDRPRVLLKPIKGLR